MTRTHAGPPPSSDDLPGEAPGMEHPATDVRKEAHIRIRCSNSACDAIYTIPAHNAGRRARCTACGALVLIPTSDDPVWSRPHPKPAARVEATGPAKSVPRVKEEAAPRPAAEIPEIRIGCIGRGHAGKTAMFHALGDSLVGDYLPSGLHLDASEPREVARMIREAEDSQRLLHRSGLPPTLQVSQTRYSVYEGDQPRMYCQMREVIGQVLTHTLPDSEPDLQARYTEYLENLVNAHVLWVVIPCPPADPDARDCRRYANDLRITLAYLREALRLRTLKEPAAVAIVLSKADALFATPEEARTALSDDVLHRALGPLVKFIELSSHVTDAAAFPVTAFGFGNSVLRIDGGERHEAPGSSEEPFGDEPIWLLKDGESPRPNNLDTLFLWSLLLGLMNQAGPHPDAALDTLCRKLRDDLEAGNPWLVSLKGGVTLETSVGVG